MEHLTREQLNRLLSTWRIRQETARETGDAETERLAGKMVRLYEKRLERAEDGQENKD